MDLANNPGFTIEKSIPKNILTEKQIALVNEARKQIKRDAFTYEDEASRFDQRSRE